MVIHGAWWLVPLTARLKQRTMQPVGHQRPFFCFPVDDSTAQRLDFFADFVPGKRRPFSPASAGVVPGAVFSTAFASEVTNALLLPMPLRLGISLRSQVAPLGSQRSCRDHLCLRANGVVGGGEAIPGPRCLGCPVSHDLWCQSSWEA